MLIVFGAGPGAAPVEAVLEEEAVAEVAANNLVGEVSVTVDVRRAGGGLDDTRARWRDAVIGIVERIDVDGLAVGVLGNGAHAGFAPEIETGGIVGQHGRFVIAVIVVDKPHPLDGIAGVIQGAEYLQEVVGNGPVGDHLTDQCPAGEVFVQDSEIAEVLHRNGAAVLVGPAGHPGEDRAVDGCGGEEGGGIGDGGDNVPGRE